MGKRHKFPMDFDNNSSSTSSSDDTSPDKAKRRKRRTRSSVNARKTEDKDIIRMLAQLNDQMCRQSDQLTQLTENKDDTCEMRKQMDNLIERQNGQCKVLEKLIESQNGQFKVLEKLIESQNGQSKELEKLIENQNGQSKELEKLAASIREQLEFHTNITGHAESDAPRSQMNQVQTPRYRLVFRSPPIDKIERGKTIDISVALVDGINNQPVENGPLASATVELVVVNSKFNQHDNQYNWPIEDFECNIVKQRCENSAKGDADQSVKSIVSNSQFNLVRGARRYSGSTIFDNSHNKKVRLGVMVVSPTKERVLEGLSNPFFVRDHVRSGRQSNLHPNSSNGQRQGLGGNDYQEENSSMPNLQQPSWSNSTHTGGIRSNIIGGQSQLPFLGTSHMLSTEPFTSQEQQSSIQQYQSPHVPMVAQATYNQNDELAWASNYLAREPNFMGNNDHVLGHAIDMQFPTIMPLQLVWDRPNVGPIKRDWNLLDQLMPLPKFNNCGLVTKLLMQEHLVSRTIISKEVMQARRNTGVIIEPLEPDDSDEERQLKRKMHSKYQLRFENKVCEGYHIMDPIKADDGNLLKVALFDGNRKITNGPLSSASVQIIVLHGDFNEHGQDYWTLEEFSRYEVCPRPGEEASSVLGGDCILVLSDGEACLSDAFFQMTSYCARTGKFKMGVRLASAQEERIQEGVSEPFWVKDRHCPGECELGIGPEDDTARINHPSVVQATMAELVTGPLPYTLKNKASSCRYNVMEGMEDVLHDGTFLHDSADAVEEADGKLKEIDERYRRYGLDGRVAMATPAATPSSSIDPCVGMVHGGTDGSLLVGIDDGMSTEKTTSVVSMRSKYQLRFENKVCEGYHIMDPIKADDGSPLKVALFDGNGKITNGPLASVSVEIIVLHGDFNEHGQDYWTSEEFSRYEVCPRPGEEASSVLGGDCGLILSNGEACLGDIFFQKTSYCARTGKFKMGVRLVSAQEERIQEGVSEPFWVKDRHCAAAGIRSKIQTMEKSRYFSFDKLETITKYFAEERKLGHGSYGVVYKGVQDDGRVIAVKKLHSDLRGITDAAFDDEILNLSKVDHPNVVRVIGYCHEARRQFFEKEGQTIHAFGIERLLCFEYVEGGSLDKHISDEICDLDWPTCYGIIRGTCEGLNHLHEQGQPIYHRDLKPANILLDRNMMPKIADLGLSKIVASTDTYRTESQLKGTPAYMPPEFEKSGLVSPTFDVFSLGAIIIRIMDGNEGNSRHFEMPRQQFIDRVTKNWKERMQGTSRSSQEKNIQQVKMCVDIALKCVENDRTRRPCVHDIVKRMKALDHEFGEPSSNITELSSKIHEDLTLQKRKQMVEFASSEDKPGVSATWQADAVPMDINNSMSYKDARGQLTEQEQPERPSLHAAPNISCDRRTKMGNRAVDLATGAMGSLLHKLDELQKEEYNLEISVKTDIESFSEELMEMQLALCKMSEVQRDNLDDQIKRWADSVREMSYDIEDVVDGFLVHSEPASNTGFFVGLMQKMFNLFKRGKTHNPIGHAIRDIKKQVQVAADRRKRFKVDEGVANVAVAVSIDPRISAIYKDQKELIGIKEPRNELIKWLSDKDGDVSKQKLKIISIVGFGGLGKTTLAKAVYDKLHTQFHPRAFVSVGRNPDVKSVLKEILRELGYDSSATSLNEKHLIDELHKLLRNKRYFLVIDDIWDSSAWDVIQCAFPINDCGGSVLTTTRILSVADGCCKHCRGYVYKMKPLSDQDSRKLFVNRIFGSQEASLDVPEEISADILKKCGGLPLAIISTASLLAHNPRSRWDSVRHSLVSLFEGDQDELKQMERILDLSYMHLPHHLKTCLLDIGKYREDCEIEKDTLLREWVAQGFVSRTRMCDAVDVAEDYFYTLINMSMIQPWTIEGDEVETCRVHDIMLDLIRSKAAEENFNLVIDGPEVVAGEHKRVRRVSIRYDGEEDGAILAAINGSLSHVRSLLLFRGSLVPSFLVLKYVRVLHLQDAACERLDLTGIRGMFLLRFLKVVCSTTGEYVKLPDQIGELQQLETIEVDIADCLGKPTSLPPDIVRLSRLMHLSYRGLGLVLPDGIGKLRSLRTLQGVDLLESSAENIKGIGELTYLRELQMCSAYHVYDEKVHKLEWKMRMDALRSCVGRLSGSLRSFIMGCHIVVPVHDWTPAPPPRRLRKLDLNCCHFPRIPEWIAHLHGLCSLELFVSEVADGLSIVARLPSLAYFKLQTFVPEYPTNERAIISGSGKSFRALKHLTLICPDLSLDFQEGALPSLEELGICFRYYVSPQLPVGIEHLPAATLRQVRLVVDDKHAEVPASELDQHRAGVESLLKRAFEPHHPAADITVCFKDYQRL